MKCSENEIGRSSCGDGGHGLCLLNKVPLVFFLGLFFSVNHMRDALDFAGP